MSRVKRGVISNKTRRKWLSLAKGYRFGRSKKERMAKEAVYHAHNYAFAHRRKRKGDFRRLWIVRINAQARKNGISYSKLIPMLKKNNIALDRKILSRLAMNHSDVFDKIVSKVK